ncbi:MAG TPA: hypothetical protein VFU94_09100 [Conexibacter sp.]|nr:hypothetical protein [Conexibacter sp.]
MTAAVDPAGDGQPTVEAAALAAGAVPPAAHANGAAQPVVVPPPSSTADEHPEYAVGAALAGGLLLGLLLKRLGR